MENKEYYEIIDLAYYKKCEEQGLNPVEWHEGEIFSYWDVMRILKEFANYTEVKK